jgi:O-antigen/teichoic acid export membrane protein
MGIVGKQSIRNTIVTYVGFAIGAANLLYMYPHWLGKTYYGLTSFILSSSNIIMPLMAFGVHNTLVKFFSEYRTEEEKNQFLSYVLLLPLIFAVPLSILFYVEYDPIAHYFASKNPIIYNYLWQVPIIGFCMGYFEIFYAWVKVHMQSVFGSFIKEIVLRIFITIGLYGVLLKWYSIEIFVNLTVIIYALITLLMLYYALKVRRFKLDMRFPVNRKDVFKYSIFIILSGITANLLLDIDKNMISKYMLLENVAFYNVAIFIATVISVPSRAMHQIAYPITAKLMSQGKYEELNAFYKKTSATLQLVGGLVFVGILVNIQQLYLLLPKDYGAGVFVVFVIGLSKYFDLILGNNNAIIFNSKYYRAVLFLGLLLAGLMIGLNKYFIDILGMGINGAAIATLISITLYSLSKLMFVVLRMKLFPFTVKTIYAFGILFLTFGVFYFWDFPFHPLINMGLKSIAVTLFFIGVNYWLVISPEVNEVIDRTVKMVLRKK